ncbi:uncharacterized protein LOC132601579 [Lycium barbarum]|uniref:uncharacterized protein LOC132601579 n=1 Tax=Lycium barbarum TaxID=112863 RepID=UPI00293F1B17|nr:uncharacterized protein LOC132601579 [Lycium barbarum]
MIKEVRCLASLRVRLLDSEDGVVVVQNRAHSSLVVKVKEKQFSDPYLLQLKEGIHRHKTMAFEQGRDDGTEVDYVFRIYHASIKMAPFEALYGRRCRSPIGWFKVGEAELLGPDLIYQAMKKVKVLSGLKKGKLSPRYIEPYRILRRVGQVAYELELPQKLAAMLRKYVGDPSLVVPTDTITIKDVLTYEEIPIAILDRQVHKLRTKVVASVKVLWRSQRVEEAKWEAKEDMKSRYPHLFEEQAKNAQGNLP